MIPPYSGITGSFAAKTLNLQHPLDFVMLLSALIVFVFVLGVALGLYLAQKGKNRKRFSSQEVSGSGNVIPLKRPSPRQIRMMKNTHD